MESQEAVELAEYDNMIDGLPNYDNDRIRPDANGSGIEQLAADYAQAKADQAELETARQVLALAISKLPKQQLKVSLTDRAHFGELALQMKVESKSGAVLFRAVNVKPVE